VAGHGQNDGSVQHFGSTLIGARRNVQLNLKTKLAENLGQYFTDPRNGLVQIRRFGFLIFIKI